MCLCDDWLYIQYGREQNPHHPRAEVGGRRTGRGTGGEEGNTGKRWPRRKEDGAEGVVGLADWEHKQD